MKTSEKNRTALFPGSFNPFTIGHADIVARGLKLFDTIIIAVGFNENKPESEHSARERVEKISRLYISEPKVMVRDYNGLTVDFARKCGAGFILRGVRNSVDFEYERNIADINRDISGIETVLMFSSPEHSFISSSVVRELQHNGMDTSRYLPKTDNGHNK